MNNTFRDFVWQLRAKTGELLLLALLAMAAAYLAVAFPTDKHFGAPSNSWHEKSGETWWWAHQLYRCDPEQLSETKRRDLDRWCRCAHLVALYCSSGLQALTDDDCREVAETLSDVWPNLEEHHGYFTIYKACRHRLAQSRQKAAGTPQNDEPR